MCGSLVEAEASDRWCGGTHNENDYTSADAVTLSNLGLAKAIQSFAFFPSLGWYLCGWKDAGKCKEACLALGPCAEVSVTRSGCCFFSRTHCVGSMRPNDEKYLLQEEACSAVRL